MKGKQLRKAVLLGMAMSMAVWTTGMAADITGPITDSSHNRPADNPYTESVTVTNNTATESAIQVNGETVNIVTGSGEEAGYDITLDSQGSGIRTEGGDNTSFVSLNSSANNVINFGNGGNGIFSESGMDITLYAAGNNIITTSYTDVGDGDGGDGINATSSGKITLTAGGSNIIKVISDGIYTEEGSSKDKELIAETGNNEITADNNGIDHRGSGNINLKAENGSNIITAENGDGIRVNGSGDVTLESQSNQITAGDNGIQVNGVGNVSVIGMTNSITGTHAGIEVVQGNVKLDDNAVATPIEGSNVSILSQSDSASYGIYLHGIEGNNGEPDEIGYANTDITADYVKISATGKNSSSSPTVVGVLSELNDGELHIKAGKKGLEIVANASSLTNTTGSVSGVKSENSGLLQLESAGDLSIQSTFGDETETVGGNSTAVDIYSNDDGKEHKITLTAQHDVILRAESTNGNTRAIQAGIHDTAKAPTNNIIDIIAGNDIHISSNLVSSKSTGNSDAINVGASTLNLYAVNGSTYITAEKSGASEDLAATGIRVQNVHDDVTSSVIIKSNIGNEIRSDSNSIYVLKTTDQVADTGLTLTAETGDNYSESGSANIAAYTGHVTLNAMNGNNTLIARDGSGIIATDYYDMKLFKGGIVELNAQGNSIDSAAYGIRAATEGQVTLTASSGDNIITTRETVLDEETGEVGNYGIYTDNAVAALTSEEGNNIIKAGTINESGYGDGKAVYASSSTEGWAASKVTLTAEKGINELYGAIDARNADTVVMLNGATNEGYSAAIIANAGDLNEDKNTDPETSFKNRKVISSLYAEDSANITVSGDWNEFRTYADNPADDTTLERTIWAYEGANIEINGSTLISTDRYAETSALQPHNSADIAIAAGTAVNLGEEDFNTPIEDGERAKVTLNYGAGSSITGDVLSAYAGKVDIAPQAATTRSNSAGISITGNLLAGNNGVLNVNLGNGGSLVGRTDDYGDANDTIVNDEHIQFFNPAFSSTIYRGGEVNLTMGSGSYWDVTGQSWLTSLKGDGGIIDMRNSENEKTTSHAVHVDTITGNHTFVMDLNHDNHNVSDMLYIKDPNASAGEQIIFINRLTGVEDMADGEKLRFATVNASTDKLSFVGQYEGENGYGNKARVMMRDIGVMDMALTIENEKYTTADTENTGYNGTDFTETKPGDEYVDETYTDGTNWYLTRTSSGDTTSDAGKTVVAMSRINYSNAVYMDRLNKRMGEARYIDGDEGLWVRMRHDRIGKSDAFRSMNTMMELGYDTRVNDREDGEHRQGVAIDYMRGTADYKNVAGEGDVRRGGIWFYDTWLGNKGHYTDYVLKFGRLSNDFELYTRTLGEKVTGDYSNFVYSASAEYGRKKDLGNNWYIEPQAQIQYAHVTDADYTTSQDTHVQLDAIDSLIGRVGFRLGKDVGEKSTFYIKADVLHEFLGDQDIEARDATGLLSTTYENEGTWYDIGLGFSHQFSKGTYMYLDMEKSIGNDNEDTYQFNFGMNWKV